MNNLVIKFSIKFYLNNQIKSNERFICYARGEAGYVRKCSLGLFTVIHTYYLPYFYDIL